LTELRHVRAVVGTIGAGLYLCSGDLNGAEYRPRHLPLGEARLRLLDHLVKDVLAGIVRDFVERNRRLIAQVSRLLAA
jgi:hypothetical protein